MYSSYDSHISTGLVIVPRWVYNTLQRFDLPYGALLDPQWLGAYLSLTDLKSYKTTTFNKKAQAALLPYLPKSAANMPYWMDQLPTECRTQDCPAPVGFHLPLEYGSEEILDIDPINFHNERLYPAGDEPVWPLLIGFPPVDGEWYVVFDFDLMALPATHPEQTRDPVVECHHDHLIGLFPRYRYVTEEQEVDQIHYDNHWRLIDVLLANGHTPEELAKVGFFDI